MSVHLQKVPDYPLPPLVSEKLRFRAGRDTLAATLLKPAGRQKPPVALLVPGRGQVYGEEMLGWAQLLARSGVAALVWDGRGNGGSTGAAAAETSERLLEDARAAFDWALARPDLGPVGLLSYSAGGWVAPMVAADRDDVAFVVTLVGPAVSLAEQQAFTTVAFLRASGMAYSEAEAKEAFFYQQQTVQLAQAGAPWSDFEAINAQALASRWREHALIPASMDDADLAYFRSHRFHAPPWQRVGAPVLAIFGEIDPLVLTADNLPTLRTALADNPDVTVLVAPGADHTLARPAGYVGEGESRYYRPWTRSAVVFDTLIAWFGERFP
ncbi:MAG: alpha/beta fold hydrolase [Cryomorphaceae bacterium]|nr:alpha/beta fold hydrolase [Cryomorphaceae bacterium]